MLLNFIDTLLNIFGNLGYPGIVALMTIESSFIPFPSELIMIPAGYLAHEGEMNILLVILSGTIGSILGALINYYIARYFGRFVIYNLAETKLAKLLFINRKKIENSERFFTKYGKLSTFTGRLIPAVRQLISIPAGLARMNIKSFIFFTFLGALIWNIFLVLIGYQFGDNKELLNKHFEYLTIIGIILFVILIMYIIYKTKRKKKKQYDKKENNL